MFFRLIGVSFLALTTSQPLHAQSGTITEPYIGCLTDAALDQLFEAINSGDNRLRDSLMGVKCVPVQGYEFSMLDRGLLRSTIRVYVGESHVDLIVPSEAAR